MQSLSHQDERISSFLYLINEFKISVKEIIVEANSSHEVIK